MTSATRTRALEIVRDVLHDEMCADPSATDADRCGSECGRVTRDVVMKLANAKLLLISQEVPAEGTRRGVGQHDDANGMCEIADALGIEATAPTERIVQGAVAAVEMVGWVNRAESTRDAWALVDAAARDAGLVVPTIDTTPEDVARIAVRAITERAAVELLGDPATASAELEAWRIVARDAWAQMVARPDGGPGPESPQALAALIGARMAEVGPLRAQLDTARIALGEVWMASLEPEQCRDTEEARSRELLPRTVSTRVVRVLDEYRQGVAVHERMATEAREARASIAVALGFDDDQVATIGTGAMAMRAADLRAARAALTTIAQAAGMSDVPVTGDGRYATDVVTALWEHAPAPRVTEASRVVLEAAKLLCVHRDADASEVLPRVRELVAEVGTLRAANSALGDVAELVGLARNAAPAEVLLAVQTGVTGQSPPKVSETLHEVARTLGMGDHPVLERITERVRELRGQAHENALCAGALDAVGRKLGLDSDATLEAIVERTGKLVESLPSPGVVAELERLRDVVAVAQRERDAALAARPDPAQQMAAAHLGALTALVMAAHEWDPTEGGTLTRPDAFSRDESGRFDERVRTTAWLLARAHAVIEEGG